MAVQHDAIVDAERHEAKHADAASNGQVLKANGDTTTSFVTPSTLSNVVITTPLDTVDINTQNPSAVDTPLTVTFGSATSNADITLSSGGTVTFNTSAVYLVTIDLVFGRTVAAGIAVMLARMLVNGAQFENTHVVELDTDLDVVPIRIQFMRSFSATNTLSVQIMRDSAGIDNGGLVSVNPVLAGWATTPSAAMKIQKLAGAA